MAWALVREFGLDRGFPLVPLMAFTPYVAIAAFLVAGIALALRNWAAAGVTALVTLCLAAVVLPRAIGAGTVDPAGRETVSVLSSNVYVGQADAEALVDLVDRYDVDLLSVQELTPKFAHQLRRAGLQRRLPNAIEETRPRSSGAGLYSRLPMRKLPGSQFFFRMPRAVLMLPDGRRLRVVGVHPYPPGRGNDELWREGLESLPAAGGDPPWVLIGDFNSTLDVSLLRETIDRGYRDAGDVAGKGLVPTWPNADHTLPPLITIDHVLADDRLGIVDYGVEDLPDSDHRSIHAELALPKAGG
ncbi:MAG TPA: endonuclease/exonuclease/phosphatase family protein [Solirubrobacterales bacterium]|nr:endonuclease/exonuclease/phosphatase family protein [Solirubrobacterales bacterium]